MGTWAQADFVSKLAPWSVTPYIVQNSEQSRIVNGVPVFLIQVNLLVFKEINHFCPRDYKICTCHSAPLQLPFWDHSSSSPILSQCSATLLIPSQVPTPALQPWTLHFNFVVSPEPSLAMNNLDDQMWSYNSFSARALIIFKDCLIHSRAPQPNRKNIYFEI